MRNVWIIRQLVAEALPLRKLKGVTEVKSMQVQEKHVDLDTLREWVDIIWLHVRLLCPRELSHWYSFLHVFLVKQMNTEAEKAFLWDGQIKFWRCKNGGSQWSRNSTQTYRDLRIIRLNHGFQSFVPFRTRILKGLTRRNGQSHIPALPSHFLHVSTGRGISHA